MPSPTSPSSSTRRWWPNFRLRTLLILLGIAAIGLAYLGNLRQRVVHQRHIVAKLGAAGYEVHYDYEYGLGDSLDYALTVDLGRSTADRELPDGRTEHTITTSSGERFIHVDRPPGSAFLRRLLGDDVFARIESVDYSFLSSATPDGPRAYDPQLLLELPDLKVVALHGAMINDETLRIVAQIPQLRVLHLYSAEAGSITHQGLEELAAAKHLESLNLVGEWVTNESIAGIRPLRNLKSLYVSHAPHLSAGVFASVAEMPELCELQILRAPQLGDEGAESLARLKKLRVLVCLQTAISDPTLIHLAKLPEIELLDVSHSRVGDAGLQHVAELSNLRILKASFTNVSDASLPAVAQLPRLTQLQLYNTAITDAGAKTLASMPLLEQLDLVDTEIGDEGALLIGLSREYERLTFGQHVSNQAVKKIRSGWRMPLNLQRLIRKSGSDSWHSSYPDDADE